MGGKEVLEVEVRSLDDFRVEPHRDDDANLIDLIAWNRAVSDRIQHAMGDAGLDRAHQDVCVLRLFDGDFTDHEGGWFDGDVAVQESQHPRMTLDLPA